MEENGLHPTTSLEACINHRHSIRFYTQDEVDENILHECVALAQRAPSNSNIQPWRLHLAQGAARERIVSALKAVANERGPNIPPLPEQFKHFRSDVGRRLYGEEGYGIKRSETKKHEQAVLRNFEFFGAPVCGVVTMHSVLGLVDAMGVGMFMEAFILALTERGLGTCLEVSVTGYPEVLKEGFKLPDDQIILCGIAIGYPAPHSKVNDLVMTREEVEAQMVLHRE